MFAFHLSAAKCGWFSKKKNLHTVTQEKHKTKKVLQKSSGFVLYLCFFCRFVS